MGKILISLCACWLLAATVSANTIVRHERTAGDVVQQEAIVPAESSPQEVAVNDGNEVLVVYGPYREPAFEVAEGDKGAAEDDRGLTRVDRFLGAGAGKINPWLRKGQQKGIDYLDSIYLPGERGGKEDYVIALRKQVDHATRQTTYISLILMLGRGQQDGRAFFPEKLPRLEVWMNGRKKEIHFQQAWVKQPWGFMLRMNQDLLAETLQADKVEILLDTSVGEERLVMPKAVIAQWREVDSNAGLVGNCVPATELRR